LTHGVVEITPSINDPAMSQKQCTMDMYIVTVEGKWRVVCDLSNDTISIDLVKIKGVIL